MTAPLYGEVLGALARARSVLLTTHVQPDGDAIGSLLALYEYVAGLGRDVRMVIQDAVPGNLRFLPHSDRVERAHGLALPPCDLAISVDASDMERLGEAAPLLMACRASAQMDHHRTNTRFAGINVVREGASSSGVIVYELLTEAGAAITRDMAINLYAAVSTDTGNFCFGAIDDRLFEQMAVLMRAGLPIAEAARPLHLMLEREQALLLGRALNSLEFLEDGRIAAMRLSRADFAACGASSWHTEGAVNYGLNIPGVRMAFLASELDDGVKFSLRCLAPWDVSRVAQRFGGGGHQLAAGCTVRGALGDSVDAMKRALVEQLHAQRHC